VHALRIGGDVAGHFDFRIEAQDVAFSVSGPEARNRAPLRLRYGARISRNAVPAQAFIPKKVDEHALIEGGVLVD
jgi:hypothetical protein